MKITKEDLYVPITWPEIQKYENMPGFDQNAEIAGSGDYTYFVSYEWLDSIGEID